jgi:hypothetical protein
MTTAQDVMCPKCGEHRLLDVIQDPMGERMFCKVCAHEFQKGSELSPKK